MTVSAPGGWARLEPRSSSVQSEDTRGPAPCRAARCLPGSAQPASVGPGGRRCLSESRSRALFKETPPGSCAAGGDGGFSFCGPVGWGLVGLGPFLPLSRLTVLAVSTSESPDRESSGGPGALPSWPSASSVDLESSRASRAARAVSVSFRIRWVSWGWRSTREARTAARSCRRGWLEMCGSWPGAGGPPAGSLLKLSCRTKAGAGLSGSGDRSVRSWITTLPPVLT